MSCRATDAFCPPRGLRTEALSAWLRNRSTVNKRTKAETSRDLSTRERRRRDLEGLATAVLVYLRSGWSFWFVFVETRQVSSQQQRIRDGWGVGKAACTASFIFCLVLLIIAEAKGCAVRGGKRRCTVSVLCFVFRSFCVPQTPRGGDLINISSNIWGK